MMYEREEAAMRKKKKSWIYVILSAALCCSACSGKISRAARNSQEQPGQSETKEKEKEQIADRKRYPQAWKLSFQKKRLHWMYIRS